MFRDGDFFDANWRGKIGGETSAGAGAGAGAGEDWNWRVKASNLRRIVRRMFGFYEALGKPLPDSWQLDVNAVAQRHDKAALLPLLQLLVGIAVNCKNKEGPSLCSRSARPTRRDAHEKMLACHFSVHHENDADGGDGAGFGNAGDHCGLRENGQQKPNGPAGTEQILSFSLHF